MYIVNIYTHSSHSRTYDLDPWFNLKFVCGDILSPRNYIRAVSYLLGLLNLTILLCHLCNAAEKGCFTASLKYTTLAFDWIVAADHYISWNCSHLSGCLWTPGKWRDFWLRPPHAKANRKSFWHGEIKWHKSAFWWGQHNSWNPVRYPVTVDLQILFVEAQPILTMRYSLVFYSKDYSTLER